MKWSKVKSWQSNNLLVKSSKHNKVARCYQFLVILPIFNTAFLLPKIGNFSWNNLQINYSKINRLQIKILFLNNWQIKSSKHNEAIQFYQILVVLPIFNFRRFAQKFVGFFLKTVQNDEIIFWWSAQNYFKNSWSVVQNAQNYSFS